MKIPQLRTVLILLVVAFFATFSARTAQACGFGRCWACRHAAAHHVPVHRTVTPMFYQIPMVAQTTTAAPQQGLTEAITLTKVLLDFAAQMRESRDGSAGSSGSSGIDSASLTEIRSSLRSLSEGQEDLKGRLINNAGIGQSLGERLVQMDEKVDKVIGENTTAIKELTDAIKKLNQGDAAAKPEAASATLSSEVDALKDKVDKMEEDLKKLDGLDAKLDKFSEDVGSKFDAIMKKLSEPEGSDST